MKKRPLLNNLFGYGLSVVAGYVLLLTLFWGYTLGANAGSIYPMLYVFMIPGIIGSVLITLVVYTFSLLKINRYAFKKLWTGCINGFLCLLATIVCFPMIFSTWRNWLFWAVAICIGVIIFLFTQRLWIAIVRYFDD